MQLQGDSTFHDVQARVDMAPDRQSSAHDRHQIIESTMARTGIDEPMIERLVRAFYERARRDPLIGPIFENRVHDWEGHIKRLCAFWSSVTLMSGRYHGQPMVAHLPLPVDTPEFNRWLEISAQTAESICPPQAASLFLERAHRIADSLEMAIASQKGEIRGKPTRPEQTMPKFWEITPTP